MADLNYATYLRLNTLLTLQEPRVPAGTDPAVARSEMFFVIAHQSSELWLKQLVGDLEVTISALSPKHGRADAELAIELLDRSAESLRLLTEHLITLEQLPARHFAQFRPHLGRASGAQSAQFARLAALVGGEGAGAVYDAFVTAVSRQGLSVTDVCHLGPRVGALYRVAEAMLDVGDRWWRWKVTHLGLVAKMLGDLPGTGGTTGAAYLAGRIQLPFPELRRLRGDPHRPATATPTSA